MRSLKLLRCLIFAMLVALCGSAFADVFEHPVTSANRSFFARDLSKMTKHEVVQGEFKQTKAIKKLNREFVSTGTFRVSKKSGVVWNTQKPFPSELTVSDSSITERNADGRVRTISTKDNPSFAEFSKVIKAVLFGDIDELEHKFKFFYEKVPDGFRVGLEPRENAMKKFVKNIVMDVSSYLDKVVMTDGTGNPVTYEFSNQNYLDE